MWPLFLRGYANTLVVSYAADSLCSLLHVATQAAFLGNLRGVLATFVVVQCVLAIPLLGLTRRLPLSVFVPIVVSSLWFAFGAVPLVFEMEFSMLEWTLILVQLSIAGYAFLRIRSLRGDERPDDKGWLFPAGWFAGRLFSFRYFVGYQSVATLCLLVGVLGGIAVAVASGVESATNGFVRLDARGISFADRRYEHEGRWIRLVGMMHIGEEEGYRTLFRDLGRAPESTLVLTEGVSDSGGTLSSGLSYAPLADLLGVEEQRAIEEYVDWSAEHDAADRTGPTFMNADVDISQFDPRTVAWLGQVSLIYSENGTFSRIVEIYEEMQQDPETAAIIFEDIVDRRNETLIDHIVDFQGDYEEIVVPWGALHLSGVETAVLEMGFVRRSSDYVPLISWSRLADALFGEGAWSRSASSV